MAKYKLLTEHVTSDGQLLPAGTEVGDGTPYPWPMDPSNEMEGVDEDGKKRVDDFWQTHYGHPRPSGGDPNLSDDAKSQLEAEEAAKQKREEEIKAGPPVSDQQKADREAEGKPVPPRTTPEPSSTATASPTRGGVRPQSPGPSTKE